MPLSPAKLESLRQKGLIVPIEKKLEEWRMDHLWDAYREGRDEGLNIVDPAHVRVTTEGFAEVRLWLSIPDLFPVWAPAHEEWSWRLRDGAQLVGIHDGVKTIIGRRMRAGRELAVWWGHLSSPETRPPNWQVSKPSKMRMSSLAAFLLDGTPQPLDDDWRGLDPDPTSLDLPVTAALFSGWLFTDSTRFSECPKCGQAAGLPCRTPRGARARILHGDERRRKALELLNTMN